MCSLVEVRHRRIDAELRPQLVQNPVSRQAVAARERKQLHEIPGSPVRPCGRGHGIAVHAHLEPAKKSHVDVLHPHGL